MKCALCCNEAELRNSHIIPKLVYKRIKSHPKSRFRSLDNITRIWQDGEKHKMLCHDCEEKFSSFETYFANAFLDDYLTNEKIPVITNPKKIDDYILSVAWRILWDDLYRLDSFESDSDIREEFENLEEDMREYLLNGRLSFYKHFDNRIYRLADLIVCPDVLEDGTLFGYAFYPNPMQGCMILVYYSGLVFITREINDRRMVITSKKSSTETDLHKIISVELVEEFRNLLRLSKLSITPDLQEKIYSFYGS